MEIINRFTGKTILEIETLRCADLSDADLRDADLSDADLRCADLRCADLRGADLSGADLRGADLDYSCWSLSCKTLSAKTDRRLRVQLAFHFLSLIKHSEDVGDDERHIFENLKQYANEFHRSDVEKL